MAVAIAQPREDISRLAGTVADRITEFADAWLWRGLPEQALDDIAVAVGRPTGLDSRRVVGVVWFNALLFQDRIADPHGLPTRTGVYENGHAHPRRVLEAWEAIREVNYLSVYDPAVKALRAFLEAAPLASLAEGLTSLASAADRVAMGYMEIFDVGAELFQKVISDRDDAASYYTRPEIAEFLARMLWKEGLAEPPAGEDFPRLMMGDFACGTGTLLRAAYRMARNALLPGSRMGFHGHMMEDGLAGIDISPIAAHLTASGLSNMEPSVTYDRTNIGVVPIGTPEGRTGSVEFLSQDEMPDLFGGTHTQAAHGASVVGSDTDDGYTLRAPFNSFHTVIMNPPYQRARGGQKIFDVAGVTENNRQLAIRNARRIIKGTPASLQAGLASVFAVLAVKTARPGGRVGLVLPMTAAAAPTWAKTRVMLERDLDDLTLVSFAAGSGGRAHSMSDDTHMGEMLVVGTKRPATPPPPRTCRGR